MEEERVPPPPPPPPPHQHLLPPPPSYAYAYPDPATATAVAAHGIPPPPFESGTYVVQIPKDQIYRVPPPENAILAERYRTPAEKSKSFRSRCLIIAVILCVIGVALALAAVISSRLIDPRTPTFKVNRLVFTNSSRPRYTLTLTARNPNPHTAIEYEDSGRSSLSFKHHQIAAGGSPAFSQGFKESTSFVLVLKGSKNARLPKGNERSAKGGGKKTKATRHSPSSVSLSLSMDYPIKRKVWVFRTSKLLPVTCNITLDKLGKGARVLSQECHS